MNSFSTPKPKKPRLNALTLVNVIAEDPLWRDCIRYNEFSGKVLVSTRFPPDGREPKPKGYREFDDIEDVLMAMLHFQRRDFPTASRNLVRDALLATAFENKFHPVRDYLNSLRWDSTDRIHRLAQDYLGVGSPEDERRKQYLEATSKCWMIAAVARVMWPGCKVDNLPVLVGSEDLGKSEGLRELCPHPDWFSEDLSTELGERDTKESLVGKWIIELSEIPHARREADRVKAFFSRRTDRYRKAYGTANADHDRQNVFVGTSNDLELISTTGNRRFWPWEAVMPIDVGKVRQDRNQLWAEAVHRYRTDEQWWLPQNLSEIAAEVQGEFTDGDESWLPRIEPWVKDRDRPFRLEHLFVEALGYGAPPEADKRDQMRAGGVLKSLGYRRKQETVDGVRGYWWRKKVMQSRG